MRAVTILDGGMGRELYRIGAPFRQPEWSALALMEAPHLVAQAHRNFVDAGAEVITSNTYACVPFHLGDELYAAEGRALVASAARIARQVADAADRPILVAGSLPPLFGSYEPELFQPDLAPVMYEMMVEAQAPFVDLWLGETVSLVQEFDAIASAVAATGKPLWVGFCLPDESQSGTVSIRSGESVDLVAEAAGSCCDAILFNCSRPEVIGLALAALVASLGETEVRVGGYANAFEPQPNSGYSARTALLRRREDVTTDAYAETVGQWIDLGATIVGGCCGIHPEQIAALAQRFGQRA